MGVHCIAKFCLQIYEPELFFQEEGGGNRVEG